MGTWIEWLLKHQCYMEMIYFRVWLRYFAWYFINGSYNPHGWILCNLKDTQLGRKLSKHYGIQHYGIQHYGFETFPYSVTAAHTFPWNYELGSKILLFWVAMRKLINSWSLLCITKLKRSIRWKEALFDFFIYKYKAMTKRDSLYQSFTKQWNCKYWKYGVTGDCQHRFG